jgi:hypothetical protein
MSRKLAGLTLSLFLALLATSATPAHAACTNYYPSRVAEVEGHAVCGYSGPGCRECVQYDQQGNTRYCIENWHTGGYTLCLDQQDWQFWL